MPDVSKTFYILTGASNTGIGTALLQQHSREKKVSVNSAISPICNNGKLSIVYTDSDEIIDSHHRKLSNYIFINKI